MKGGNCVVWDQAGCQGRYADSNGPVNGCSDFKSYGWGQIRSFKCQGCKSVRVKFDLRFTDVIDQKKSDVRTEMLLW